MTRKILQTGVMLLGIAGLLGCSGQDHNGPITLKMAYVMGPVGAAHEAAQEFARLVEEKTEGTVTVKLYPSAQLGKDRELAEGLAFGNSDFVLGGLASVAAYIPQYEALEAPFTFRDYEHMDHVLHGEIGKEVAEKLRELKGILILEWWPRGPRYLTSNKPIHSPEDVKGMRLRVPELPTYIEAWRILGANTTPITYSEMFMALKQGLVEGQENPLEVIQSASLYEVQDYVIETRHMLSAYMLMTHERVMERLDPAQQQAIREAAHEAAKFEFEVMQRKESEYVEALKNEGMEFIPVDSEAFRTPVVEALPERLKGRWAPGFFQRIQEVE